MKDHARGRWTPDKIGSFYILLCIIRVYIYNYIVYYTFLEHGHIRHIIILIFQIHYSLYYSLYVTVGNFMTASCKNKTR